MKIKLFEEEPNSSVVGSLKYLLGRKIGKSSLNFNALSTRK